MKREPSARRYRRFWGTDPSRDVDEELAFHLAMRMEEFQRAGMSDDDAKEAVMKRFGDMHEIRAEVETIARNRHDRIPPGTARSRDIRLGERGRRGRGVAEGEAVRLLVEVRGPPRDGGRGRSRCRPLARSDRMLCGEHGEGREAEGRPHRRGAAQAAEPPLLAAHGVIARIQGVHGLTVGARDETTMRAAQDARRAGSEIQTSVPARVPLRVMPTVPP